MHVEDATLLALLDGESTDREREELLGHLDSCDTCAGRLDELRFADRRVKAALESLDAATPWSEMPEALRAASHRAVTPIHPARPHAVRIARRSVAAAAGLVFLLAAAAYAVPGSPVRDLVSRSASAIGALFGGDAGPADPGPVRVAVDPLHGSIRVSILDATSDLRITIRTTEERRASVSARGAGFGVEAGVIQVRDASGDMSIALPTTSEAVVEVNGIVVAHLIGGSLARTDRADASPATIILETGG